MACGRTDGAGQLVLVVGWRLPPYGVRAKVSSDDGCSWSDWIVLRDDAGTGDIGADTANCIIIGHFLHLNRVGRPVSLRCVIKKWLGSSQNGLKIEHRRVSKPFLRFSS